MTLNKLSTCFSSAMKSCTETIVAEPYFLGFLECRRGLWNGLKDHIREKEKYIQGNTSVIGAFVLQQQGCSALERTH